MNWSDEEDAFEAAVPLSQRAMAARPGAVGGVQGDYLADLNPAQREAVLASDGPVLMLAGAGTGKTKALMARIAHLIATQRAQAHRTLALDGNFPLDLGQDPAPPCRVGGPEIQLHHSGHRRSVAPAEATGSGRQYRRKTLAAAASGRNH